MLHIVIGVIVCCVLSPLSLLAGIVGFLVTWFKFSYYNGRQYFLDYYPSTWDDVSKL